MADCGGCIFVMAGCDRPSAFDDETSAAVDVAEEEVLRREAGGGPLLEVAVGAHDGLGGLEDGPQGGKVEGSGRADYHLS
jgi:hypothetical protein